MRTECRCGAHDELPQGSIELFTVHGDIAMMLCPACTLQAIKFVTNQATEVVMPKQVSNQPVIIRSFDPEDWEWDDLTIPIEEWVNEDLPSELRREAS